jgi:hypothetical protein
VRRGPLLFIVTGKQTEGTVKFPTVKFPVKFPLHVPWLERSMADGAPWNRTRHCWGAGGLGAFLPSLAPCGTLRTAMAQADQLSAAFDQSGRRADAPRRSGSGCSALTVVQDIYHMKTMAVEVVAQVASEDIRFSPGDLVTAARLTEQVEEEFGHIRVCQSFLLERRALGPRPRYVDLYARLMRNMARRRHRFLPLALATAICTAVEVAALKQLSEAALGKDSEALFKRLHSEEHDHFELVARVIAPRAAAQASSLERFHANLTTLGIVLIAGLSWWPARIKVYAAAGLDIELFGREVIRLLSPPLATLGLVLSPRLLHRSVEFALRHKIEILRQD